jgi:formylglycine-generating enzyme
MALPPDTAPDRSNWTLWLIILVVVGIAGAAGLMYVLTTRSTLVLRTTPSDVTVEVDGEIAGVTTDSSMAISVSAGDVQVRLRREGYVTEELVVPVRRGEVVEIEQVMRPPGMVYVRGGRFRMGADDGAFSERPAHDVALKPYYMDLTEVTVRGYREYASNYASSFAGGDMPATNIAWSEADAFCKSIGKRLPTEAEWERACAGPSGMNYAYGDTFDPDKGRSGVALKDGPAPVGSFSEQDARAQDLTGNVWEWCSDWYGRDYYRDSPVQDPKGSETGERHVLRGGAWFSNASFSNCTHRPGNIRSERDPSFGFRCVKDLN